MHQADPASLSAMSVLCISSHLLSPLCCVSVKVDCRFASRVKVKKTCTQCRRTLVSLFVIRLPLNNFSLDRFQIAGRDLYCRSFVEYLANIFSNKCIRKAEYLERNSFTTDSDCFVSMIPHCLWLQRIKMDIDRRFQDAPLLPKFPLPAQSSNSLFPSILRFFAHSDTSHVQQNNAMEMGII